MTELLIRLLNLSIQAAALIVIVAVLHVVLRRAPKWLLCLLWAIVGIRLVCPFSVESAFSLAPKAKMVHMDETNGQVSLQSGAETVDQFVNRYVFRADEGETAEYSIALDQTNDASRQMTSNGKQGLPWGTLAVFWVCGMMAGALYLIISYARVALQVRGAVKLEKGIYACDGISTPFILGVLRPRIYLPSEITEEQKRSVVAHERAHLRRKDHVWKPLGFVLLTIYWFQPFCWLAYFMLCRDIELACDERVIRDMDPEEKKTYSKVLLSFSAPGKLVSACPLSFGEAPVKKRIRAILNYKKPAFWVLTVSLLALCGVAIFFLTSPGEKVGSEPENDQDEQIVASSGSGNGEGNENEGSFSVEKASDPVETKADGTPDASETFESKALYERPVTIADGMRGTIRLYGVEKLFGGENYGITSVEVLSEQGERLTQFTVSNALLATGLGDSDYLVSPSIDAGLIVQDVTFDGYADLGLRTIAPDGSDAWIYWECCMADPPFYVPLGAYKSLISVNDRDATCAVFYTDGAASVHETYVPDSWLGLALVKRSRTTVSATGEQSVEVENTCLDVTNPVYAQVLVNLMESRVLPNYPGKGYLEVLADPEKNYYCIMDIDGDRREELLINICNAYGSSGDMFLIYDCDAQKKEARLEFLSPYVMLRFIEVWKDSGMERYVKMSASHNHGRSDMDDFWPYTIYQYDAKLAQYEFVGEIDAWQKELYPEGFPAEADKDGNGIVYYMSTEYGTVLECLDDAEYEKWMQEKCFDSQTTTGGGINRTQWRLIR